MKETKIVINEMINEIIHPETSLNLQAVSSSSSPSLSNSIKKVIMMCNYNSNLHLLSYTHLSALDKYYANLLIIISMLTGFIELINYNLKISTTIYLIIGIFNIMLGIMFNKYKDLNLNIDAQKHYEFHNYFEKIKIKVEMNNSIKRSDAFLFKNIECFLKHTNTEIELLYVTRPSIPTKILNKYDINKANIRLKNNNQVSYNKKKSKIFDINKSFNFLEIEVSDEDLKEYNYFMDNIKQKNIEKIKMKNDNIIHFKI